MPSYPYTPQELATLPFNLRRAQLNPVNPPLVAQGIEDQFAGSYASEYMPQKTMFTKWQTGPARKSFLATAVGATQAGAIYSDMVRSLTGPVEADKGIFTPFDASRALSRLPQPMENWEFDSDPIARGLLNRPITQAQSLDAYAASQQDPGAPAFSAPPTVTQETLLSTALEGNMTPLGGLRGLGATRGRGVRRGSLLRGLGRAGMGFAALGDPFDVMAEQDINPKAEGIVLPPATQTSNQATPGASSQVVTTVTTPAAVVPATASPGMCTSPIWRGIFALAGLAGAGLGIYHGWNRTHSTPWTAAWGVAGGLFPIIAIPVMLVQGFGKRGR